MEELLCDNTGECGSDHATDNWFLGHGARKEVDIFQTVVGDAKSTDSVVIHNGQQLAPVADGCQTASFSPG